MFHKSNLCSKSKSYPWAFGAMTGCAAAIVHLSVALALVQTHPGDLVERSGMWQDHPRSVGLKTWYVWRMICMVSPKWQKDATNLYEMGFQLQRFTQRRIQGSEQIQTCLDDPHSFLPHFLFIVLDKSNEITWDNEIRNMRKYTKNRR